MKLDSLQAEIRRCTICAEHLPTDPRPVLRCHSNATILLIGQAPGRKVNESGIPWDDPSGKRLLEWMGIDDQTFYESGSVAIMPMGFCYPGTGRSGDLPPRPECADAWHDKLLLLMPKVKLTLLLSQYALSRCLPQPSKVTLTETVKRWREFVPTRLPLPHPSPRNNRWLKNNPWFDEEVIPYLQKRVHKLVARHSNGEST